MPYRIDMSQEALRHLHLLTARQRSTTLDSVEEQLRHQPTVETRNRIRMRPNLFGDWELRIGDIRVYYKVEEEPEQVVSIRGVGVKSGLHRWRGSGVLMKTLDISQVQRLLKEYPDSPDQAPIMVTRDGKPLAVLLNVQGADLETISLTFDPTFRAIMERSAQSCAQEGGVSLDEARRELGMERAPKVKERKSNPRRVKKSVGHARVGK